MVHLKRKIVLIVQCTMTLWCTCVLKVVAVHQLVESWSLPLSQRVIGQSHRSTCFLFLWSSITQWNDCRQLDSIFSGDLLYFSRVCSHFEIVAAYLSILELVHFAVEYIAQTTCLHMTMYDWSCSRTLSICSTASSSQWIWPHVLQSGLWKVIWKQKLIYLVINVSRLCFQPFPWVPRDSVLFISPSQLQFPREVAMATWWEGSWENMKRNPCFGGICASSSEE